MDDQPSGFKHHGDIILYIDAKGKDASFERWRADLYYRPSYAKTEFFYDEFSYEVFLAANRPKCYTDYGVFRDTAKQEYQDYLTRVLYAVWRARAALC